MGLDFQALLLPLFESCSLQLFGSHLSAAVDAFNLRLEGHKWVAMPAPMMGRGRAEKQQQQQVAAAAAAAAAGEGEDHVCGGRVLVVEYGSVQLSMCMVCARTMLEG